MSRKNFQRFDPFRERRKRLHRLMEQRKLSLLLVRNPVNIYYLTGFRGSTGLALSGPSETILWVDPRYTLQARDQAHEVEVIEERRGLLKGVGRWLRQGKHSRIGYEDSRLTCREFALLKEEAQSSVKFKPAGDLVEDLRTVKDAQEIEKIRQAGRITVEVLQEVVPMLRRGVRELELAAEIGYRMRQKGAEGEAFETIVAFGDHAALPHARPSPRILRANELIVFDMGAVYEGYAADLTRTFYLGRPSQRVRRLYQAVQKAQRKAVEALSAGVTAGRVDSAARSYLKGKGLAQYFTHSTGHGVGLEIHEGPRLGQGEKTRLEAGFVVTAEPGIYLQHFGGIRIEDTVSVRAEGPEVLTPAPQEPWSI